MAWKYQLFVKNKNRPHCLIFIQVQGTRCNQLQLYWCVTLVHHGKCLYDDALVKHGSLIVHLLNVLFREITFMDLQMQQILSHNVEQG